MLKETIVVYTRAFLRNWRNYLKFAVDGCAFVSLQFLAKKIARGPGRAEFYYRTPRAIASTRRCISVLIERKVKAETLQTVLYTHACRVCKEIVMGVFFFLHFAEVSKKKKNRICA